MWMWQIRLECWRLSRKTGLWRQWVTWPSSAVSCPAVRHLALSGTTRTKSSRPLTTIHAMCCCTMTALHSASSKYTRPVKMTPGFSDVKLATVSNSLFSAGLLACLSTLLRQPSTAVCSSWFRLLHLQYDYYPCDAMPTTAWCLFNYQVLNQSGILSSFIAFYIP